MKSILYIGNKLNSGKSNLSSIDILGPLLEKEGFKVQYASSEKNKFLRLGVMIFKVFKNRRVTDFILIDTYSTQNFYYALLVSQVCRLLRKQYIPLLHGGNLPLRLKENPKMSKWIFNNSFINISPSLYLLESFRKDGYQNIAFIPNSIKIVNYQYYKRNYQEINLLWVRSFSEIYNPIMAVEVLKGLVQKGYNASLCMVGPDSDGSLSVVKKLTLQLGLDVKFTGKLSKDKWMEISKDYNVFLNTTNFDNMPVSVIEAMALGLPIVSTDVGGIPYLIKQDFDGLLVEPNNHNAMIDSILKLFKNPEATNEMTLRARKKVEQFDWRKVKYEWLDLLN